MRTETFDALAGLLTYPRSDFGETLDGAIASCSGARSAPFPGSSDDPVATTLLRFRDAVVGLPLHELEEAFTTTFDLDPVAALEVGWHLFGDTYERGRFLVEMRQRLHRLGMSEAGELPDHLATVLRVLPRLDRAEAEALARGAVVPALHKMLEPLRSRESLYLPLLQSVDALLAEVGTGCAGPFPDPAHDETRIAAGGPCTPEPAAASHDIAVGTGCAGPSPAPLHDIDPEVTA